MIPKYQDPLLIPGGQKMPAEHNIDVNGELQREGVSAHQLIMTESKGNIQSSNNILRHTAVKKFDQVDTIESAAVEKVLQAKTGGNSQ